ncbi:MAG: helix-turn-helix domain-containing protein [Cypionkella sp.]
MAAPPPPPAPRLPGTPRMRYWRPDPAFAGLVSGYHLYAVQPPAGGRQQDAFQPAWPILRFTFGEPATWRVRPPRGGWQAVPPVALFGPSSGVTWSDTGAGLTVGMGILPRGWGRLATSDAAAWTNRVAEPGTALRGDWQGLALSLASVADDEQVPALFDRYLAHALATARPENPAVAAFEAALLDPDCRNVCDLVRAVGVSTRSLERLARKAFGFPPKLLIRRARFLRSLHAVAAAPAPERAAAIDATYTDYSHFVRDAHEFLGMSPQAFLKLDNPLLKQSLALRKAVLGAPAQALSGAGNG